MPSAGAQSLQEQAGLAVGGVDLKDVLQDASESGKTGSRDLSLDRPNIVLILGVDGAARRLARLIDLGDRMLRRLVASRPKLRFLQALRTELGEEALRLMRNVCDREVGEAA